MSPSVVTPINCVVDPDRDIETWFIVRPVRAMVVQTGELTKMSLVYLTALVARSKNTTLDPLIATCSTVYPVPRDRCDHAQDKGFAHRYSLPERDVTADTPSVV